MTPRPPRLARLATVATTAMLLCLATGCSGSQPARDRPATPASTTAAASESSAAASRSPRAQPASRPVAPQLAHPLPGMPRVLDGDVYSGAVAGAMRNDVGSDPAYLYVPNSYGVGITTVIDQRTRKIVRVLRTGELSQHVTPSWDMRHLYVEASVANRLVEIDPKTGKIIKRIPQVRPYNLYFTPDGKHGVVMREQDNAVIFTSPRTFRPQKVISDPSCLGPNHADFSANGRYFIVSCEFSGSLLKISTLKQKVVARLKLPAYSKPQDVRLSPDGRTFYVADMGRDKLLRIGWRTLTVVGHTDTPSMPHGIYPSRDGKVLYVSDRAAGEVSVVSVKTNKIVDTWTVPGGGSPDMGGLSADGKTLWLSGRYDGEVYGWNTRTGKLIARIKVPEGSPHGLLVWPQPGRYSLGHTGNMR